MSKHTPTPWHVVDHSWEHVGIYPAVGSRIALCEIDGAVTEDTQEHYEAINDANARRIVACVNACGDLTPDQLQVITEKNILQQMNARADAEAQACDLLRKVLDNVKDYCVELRAALELHQELTRPIQRTMDILEKTKGYKT